MDAVPIRTQLIFMIREVSGTFFVKRGKLRWIRWWLNGKVFLFLVGAPQEKSGKDTADQQYQCKVCFTRHVRISLLADTETSLYSITFYYHLQPDGKEVSRFYSTLVDYRRGKKDFILKKS